MLTLVLVAQFALAGAPAPGTPAPIPAVVAEPDELPDTPQGRAAAAFIRAINEGSAEAVRRFEETYRSEAQRGAVPIEERVRRFSQLHADLAPLSVTRVTTRANGELTVVAKAANGSTVVMEPVPATNDAGRVDGIRLRIGGDAVEPRAVSPEEVASAVRAAGAALTEGYVYPKVGLAMSESILAKLDHGGYAGVADDLALADALTSDLRAVSHDLHLGVEVVPPAAREEHGADPEAGLREMAAENSGFREVQVLPGNIGYLRFDFFVPGPEAERTGAAAMEFVRGCDAVVFDLRANGGGSPEMIRFLTSYLFDSPTHLNDMVDRDGKVVEEYWTLESVPGERLRPDLPVFVLTSSRTFSGAEEFSYNLKNLGRATIVGEQTGGGAHPVRAERIGERLMLRVPFMRAQNPISKTNWEGLGVEPDVKVPSSEALDRAIALAREAIAASPRASR